MNGELVFQRKQSATQTQQVDVPPGDTLRVRVEGNTEKCLESLNLFRTMAKTLPGWKEWEEVP